VDISGGGTFEGGVTIDDLEVDTSFNLSGNLESHIVPDTDGAYDIGGAGADVNNLYLQTAVIMNGSTGVSGTYNFYNDGTSGNVTQMVITGGIITSVTTAP
jgi:hypothetical protein